MLNNKSRNSLVVGFGKQMNRINLEFGKRETLSSSPSPPLPSLAFSALLWQIWLNAARRSAAPWALCGVTVVQQYREMSADLIDGVPLIERAGGLASGRPDGRTDGQGIQLSSPTPAPAHANFSPPALLSSLPPSFSFQRSIIHCEIPTFPPLHASCM